MSKNRLTDKELYIKRNKERPWYKHFKAARQRCNNINASNYKYYGGCGIKCLITEEELKELWFRDRAWVFKEAHLSRKNHRKNYSFDNCFFTNKKENVGESNSRNKRKIVLQFTLDGIFIKEWSSITEASLNTNTSHIYQCCNGKFKQCNGFIWRYK